METNFTRSGLIVRLLTVMLISFIANYSASAQSCACKESVQVSLDNNGTAVVTPSMLKADDATCGGAGTVTVMLTQNGTAIPGSPSVNCSHAGKTLYGKVTSGTNSCWSRLIVEDKQKPASGSKVITCVHEAVLPPASVTINLLVILPIRQLLIVFTESILVIIGFSQLSVAVGHPKSFLRFFGS